VGRSWFDRLTMNGHQEPLALSLPALSTAEGSKGILSLSKGILSLSKDEG
jgi:hypothetical protein